MRRKKKIWSFLKLCHLTESQIVWRRFTRLQTHLFLRTLDWRIQGTRAHFNYLFVSTCLMLLIWCAFYLEHLFWLAHQKFWTLLLLLLVDILADVAIRMISWYIVTRLFRLTKHRKTKIKFLLIFCGCRVALGQMDRSKHLVIVDSQIVWLIWIISSKWWRLSLIDYPGRIRLFLKHGWSRRMGKGKLLSLNITLLHDDFI